MLLGKTEKFMLVGIIACEKSTFNSKLNHYVAYSRSLKNKWCLREDLLKKPKYLNKNSSYSVSVVLMMYEKSQMIESLTEIGSDESKLIDISNCDVNSIVLLSVNDLLKHEHFVKGLLLPPVEYKSVLVKVSNTCPIDSIVELVIHTILNYKIFHNFFYESSFLNNNMNILKFYISMRLIIVLLIITIKNV